MDSRTPALDALVDELRRRHGPRAARRGAELPPPPPPAVVSTGLAALDAALPGGGLPRGALTELAGPRSAGATTVALLAVAAAQAAGELACVLDLGGSLAPDAAAAVGVDLAALAIARPAEGAEAAMAAQTLLARRAVGVLVVDSLPRWLGLPGGAAGLSALLRRLPRLLPASGCAVVVLNPLPTGLLPDPSAAPPTALAPVAALRLRLAHRGWARRGPAIIGCRAGVTVLEPPFAEPRAALELELAFARAEGQA